MEKRFDVLPGTWDAVDGLGRMMPCANEVGTLRKDRFVGLFYWTWHNQPGGIASNNTQVIREHPEAQNDYNHPVWKDITMGHWDEPLFGYYKSYDKWVLRKHVEMLADAQVDVVIFDNTNGTQTWDRSYQALADVFSQARKDGVQAPCLSFLLPLFTDETNQENTRVQLRRLYTDFFQKGLHRELWFYWEGKPLIMAYPEALDMNEPLDREIRDFFTFRPGQPSYIRGQERPDHWGWLSVYPQKVYRKADGTPEQMTVGVAQNHNEAIGLTAMNGKDIFGRHYTSKGFDDRPDAKLHGANFSEQFEYALRVDPEFIFITGWNEWIAGRYETWCRVPNAFPDEFNDVYSRDLEPSAGDLKDHYYYQMVDYIRRYKGVPVQANAFEPSCIDMSASRAAWDDSYPVYGAYAGGGDTRDEYGYGNIHYTNDTMRNHVCWSRVTHDAQQITFAVACDKKLCDKSVPAWMRLFIRVRTADLNWEGFQYVVNRVAPGEKAVLERSRGGWDWEKAAEVSYRIDGNRLLLSIPRVLLNLNTPEFKLWFKWNDNAQKDGDILDFYINGCTAPGGRFMYFYHGKD